MNKLNGLLSRVKQMTLLGLLNLTGLWNPVLDLCRRLGKPLALSVLVDGSGSIAYNKAMTQSIMGAVENLLARLPSDAKVQLVMTGYWGEDNYRILASGFPAYVKEVGWEWPGGPTRLDSALREATLFHRASPVHRHLTIVLTDGELSIGNTHELPLGDTHITSIQPDNLALDLTHLAVLGR